MKERQRTSLKIFLAAIGLLALLGAILRSVCLFTLYEGDVGYFESNPLTKAVELLPFAGLIACAAIKLVFPTDLLAVNEKCHSRIAPIVRILSATIFLACGVITLGNGAVSSIKLDIFNGVFCILSTLFFLPSALSATPRFRGRLDSITPWGGIAVIASMMLSLASAYFDMTVTINGPFTALYLFSLLACSLFMLCELRLLIGRPAPRAHLAAGLGATVLSVPCAVGNLLFCLFGDAGAAKTIAEPTRPLILLAVILYILTRLTTFDVQCEAEKNEEN